MSSTMTANVDQCSMTTHSFRFGSGEVITLDEQQINRIPYLAALVSSVDRFVGVRDEQDNLRLDPNIEFKYFSFILQASSFHSVQELLNHMPVEEDVTAMIAHLDFLGLINEGNPTLDEVDKTFFCTLIYDIHDQTYLEKIRPSTIRNIAARFTFALAREEYDFADDQVMDRIYWYVMFILSAASLFDCHFRGNVCRVAENCFRLFKPPLLGLLKKLQVKTGEDTSQSSSLISSMDTNEYEESDPVLEQLINSHARKELSESYNNGHFALTMRLPLLRSLHQVLDSFSKPSQIRTREEILFDIILEPISQIVYTRLQNAITRRANEKVLLPRLVFVEAIASSDLLPWSWFLSQYRSPTSDDTELADAETIKIEALQDLIDDELVQDEIRNLILTAIPIFVQILERRHFELVQLQQSHNYFPILLFGRSREDSENLEADTLALELLLQKLRQESITINEVQELVVNRLYETALTQIESWIRNQFIICLFRKYLSASSRKRPSSTTRKRFTDHRCDPAKPLPKKQLKHQKR